MAPSPPPRKAPRCSPLHLTGGSIATLWYTLSVGLLTGYLVYRSVTRFLAAASLPWPQDEAPYVALNAYVGLVGAAVVITPFHLLTAVQKVGNLANDGVKLGSSLSTCSSDPAVLPLPAPGLIRMLWTHGPPASAFLHLLSAFCLLLPHSLLDAQLLHAGLLPTSEIWSTDLDLVVPHTDRIRVLSTLPPPPPSSDIVPPSLSPINPISPGLPSASLLREVEPHLQYLKDSNKQSNFDSIGDLPVGATVPIAKLNEVTVDDKKSEKSSLRYPAGSSKYTRRSRTKEKRLPLGRGLVWKPFSPEFLNCMMALIVYAIRYPSVFWATNKGFSILFSIQMIFSAIQTLLFTSAFTIFYKLQTMGGVTQVHGSEGFLLSVPVAAVLFIATITLLSLSCCCVYVHGYHKFLHFLTKSQQKYQISCSEDPPSVSQFGGHLGALVVLVLLCLSSGPLLWDLSRVYRGALDRVVLAAVIATIAYIFAWIALWLFFTVKRVWTFKLRVTVARACVSSARSIKLVTDVELRAGDPDPTRGAAPLLVVGHGRAFAVPHALHKKAIMSVVQKAHKTDNPVYWHRPASSTRSPKPDKRKTDSPKRDSPSEGEDDAGDYALLLEDGTIGGPSAEKSGKLSRGNSDARYVDRKQILAYRRQSRAQKQEERNSQETEEDTMPPLPPPPPELTAPHLEGLMTPQSSRSPDSGLVVQEDPALHRSDSTSTTTSSTATNQQPDQSTSSTNTATNQSEQSEARNRCGSDEDLSQLPDDPSNFPSYPRALRSTGGLYNDSTVVIKRQRNLTREIQPVDPIYGTRTISSFKEDPVYGARGPGQEEGEMLARSQNKANSQRHGHGLNVMTTVAAPSPGLATPPPPMAPLHQHKSLLGHSIYGQTSHHPLYGQTSGLYVTQSPVHHQHIYGKTGQNKLPQAPQIPLPPIPQGSVADFNPSPPLSSPSPLGPPPGDLYPGGPITTHSSFRVPSSGRVVSVGRSSSLRFAPGTPPRHFTNSLPHVMPRSSQYNTGV